MILDFAVSHSLQFRSFHDPEPGKCLDRRLAREVQRQVVGKPLVLHGQHLQRLRLVGALLAFEHHKLVKLAARLAHATHGSSQQQRADSRHVFRVVRPAVAV